MLKGLEASEQKWSALERTYRLDAEYFRHDFMECAAHLAKMPTAKVTEVAKVSDGNHFSISERFQDEGIPYYRGQDVSGHFFVEECSSTFINEATFNEKHIVRSHLRKGDILLSIVGTIGQLALVSTDIKATCSCKLAILRMKSHARFLSIFLKTRYGALQIERNTRGAVQMGLLLADMDQLRVPVLSDPFMSRIDALVETARQKSLEATTLYEKAQDLLLEELGLKNWQPEDPLSYVAKSSDVSGAERLDAEYFKPMYGALKARLRQSPWNVHRLEELVEPIRNGFDCREFIEQGTPYIRVGDISPGQVHLNACNRIPLTPSELPKDVAIREGDVLFTRKGSFGNCAVASRECQKAIISSEIMRLRLKSSDIRSAYLALYLNSIAGRLQVQQRVHGVAFYSISQPDLAEVMICALATKTQDKLVATVQQSQSAQEESKALLEKAKRTVEIAVERGEEAAVVFLDGKAYLEAQALPAMTEQHKYFGLDALKQYLVKQKLTYAPETVNAYVSQMKRDGKIFSAGRGWYSSIAAPFEMDPEPVAALVADLGKRFPLLEFACWSTGQLNPYLHHTLGKPVPFVYVERDAMPSVFDGLEEMGYRAYLNPTRREAVKSFVVTDKTVVIRPVVTKAPVDGHHARIEKLLVDLHVELETFPLLEPGEFREAAQSLMSQRRIDLAKLLMYAAQRRVDWRAIFLAPDAVIAWDGPA